ncbi:hypothetical protein F4779DRAFT_641346 [Xylariaceae sp. FL0662B]|nr:hypothetical protein F4779DRAFT_641346 [Xylariaceae sp. FL0662B]
MHLTTVVAAILSFAALSTQTCAKANEYASTDCNQSTFEHHCFTGYRDITMDDKTHSVYLGTPDDDMYKWQGYSGKTKNGGDCSGDFLGDMPHHGCNLLNFSFKKRVKCVRLCMMSASAKKGDGYWACK